MAQHIQGVYIADGFADDCDELMHYCLKEETLTFEIFSEIWKKMQLSCIFQDRSSGAEIAELSEEVIHIAKHYMVANTSNFEESVAGLFLVYSLLNLQPFANFASLRIVQEDVPAIERIELVARRDRRQDVLYILGSVLIQGPVQYQAVLRERGMEYPLRKYLEGYTTMDRLGVRPKGVFYRQNEELDIIKELNNIGIRYNNAKAEITGTGQIERSLSYVNENFGKEMGASLKNIISGIIDDDDSNGSSDDSHNSIDAIRALKDRAMKAKVKPIRHRIGASGRAHSSPIRTDIKTPSGKIKSISPTKVTASYKNKAKSKASRKRKRGTLCSLTSSEDDEIKQDTAGSVTEDPDNQINPNSYGDDLDLSKFVKEIQPDTEDALITDAQEVDLKIDSLPDVIRTETNGHYYEIEIIKLDAVNQEVENIANVAQGPSTSAENESEKSDKLIRAEKRDLKKTIVKSRFKRMGMLPVANFQTK